MSELIICDLEVSSETPPSLVKAAIISARQETRVEGLRCGPCSDETPPHPSPGRPQAPAPSLHQASFVTPRCRSTQQVSVLRVPGSAGGSRKELADIRVEEPSTRYPPQRFPCLHSSSSSRNGKQGMLGLGRGFSRLITVQEVQENVQNPPNTRVSVPAAWLCSLGLCSSLAPGGAEVGAARSFPCFSHPVMLLHISFKKENLIFLKSLDCSEYRLLFLCPQHQPLPMCQSCPVHAAQSSQALSI